MKEDLSNADGRPAVSSGLGDRVVLVTGASSLLGRLVVAELLGRGCRVLALLRASSPLTAETFSGTIRGVGEVPWSRLELIRGDLWEADLGLGPDILSRLRGVTEIVHLARPRARDVPLLGALVKGHDGVIELGRRLGGVRRLVVLSSTEVVGDFPGRFYEDWLDIGQTHSTQRGREALEAEARAREAAKYLPIAIVRHALLVGHSRTGQMECDAGFGRLLGFGLAAARLPSILRPPGPAAGQRYLTVSPIDFVAGGIAELTFHEEVSRRETFCLADPTPPTLSELYELLLDRAGGPSPGVRIPVEGRGAVGLSVELVARLGSMMTGLVGGGQSPWSLVLQRGEHDVSNALRLLEPAGIRCPRLQTYLDVLYEDYRRRHRRSRH